MWGSKTKTIGALGLHLARIILFVRAPSRKRLWALGSMVKIAGLQGTPPTLL